MDLVSREDIGKEDDPSKRSAKRKLPLQCRVEGCEVDLSALKAQNKADYRVRYKICDEHLKALEVQQDGKLMRFCQQCTSLHEVAAFDGNKRSCRERLSSHNARRRKRRQPGEAASAPKTSSAPNVQGLDALQNLLSSNALTGLAGGSANAAVLSKIYELLAANTAGQVGGAGAEGPKLDEPGSAQLLKSAADMLGSMGATGVQGAVAALQQAKPASVTQNSSAVGMGPGLLGVGVEQLSELLGTYSQLFNHGQRQHPSQGLGHDSLLGGLPTSTAVAAVAQPGADQLLLANLANSGLLGQANNNFGHLAELANSLQQKQPGQHGN